MGGARCVVAMVGQSDGCVCVLGWWRGQECQDWTGDRERSRWSHSVQVLRAAEVCHWLEPVCQSDEVQEDEAVDCQDMVLGSFGVGWMAFGCARKYAV